MQMHPHILIVLPVQFIRLGVIIVKEKITATFQVNSKLKVLVESIKFFASIGTEFENNDDYLQQDLQ